MVCDNVIVTFPGHTHLLSHKESMFKVAIGEFRLNAVPIYDSKLYISFIKQIVDFLVSLLLHNSIVICRISWLVPVFSDVSWLLCIYCLLDILLL